MESVNEVDAITSEAQATGYEMHALCRRLWPIWRSIGCAQRIDVGACFWLLSSMSTGVCSELHELRVVVWRGNRTR